jgi:hypothetical protein
MRLEGLVLLSFALLDWPISDARRVRMSGPKRPRASSQDYLVFLATEAALVFAAGLLATFRAGAFFLAAFGAAFAFAAVLGFAFAGAFLALVAFADLVGIAMGTPLR